MRTAPPRNARNARNPVSLPLAAAALACLAAAQPATAQIDNGGFESGTAPWFGVGATLAPSTGPVRTGNGAARLSGRTAFWNSIAQSVLGELNEGEIYRFTAWVYADAPGDHFFKLTLRQDDDAGTSYIQVSAATLPGREWHELSGLIQHQPDGPPTTLLFYAEGPGPGVDLYLDDVTVEPLGPAGDWVPAADERIAQIRMRDATLSLRTPAGVPIAGAEVRATQTSSDFAFGSAIAATALDIPEYTAFFAEHFEWAVPENAAKWPQTEPTQGDLRYDGFDAIAAFCETTGIRLRGHTVFWAVDQFVQDWVKSLDDASLWSAMGARVRSVVQRHAGLVEHWDVNNEMLHGSFYRDRLGDQIVPWMFQQAAAAAPGTLLFVNDYSVISADETDAYVDQIEGLLAAGAPVGGIGAQGHFFGPVNPVLVLDRLDRLAAPGLPVWITELDVASPDPQTRADRLEQAMRACFSHPAVDGILLWGFWEGRHWRGADAALVDLDWTVNAAGRRYLDLRDEWTTDATRTTDAAGNASFRGFHGGYTAEITLPDGSTAVRAFHLPAGEGAAEVALTVPFPCSPADTDADGALTFADVSGFIAAFGAGTADLTGDGVTNFADVSAFIAAFGEGCP